MERPAAIGCVRPGRRRRLCVEPGEHVTLLQLPSGRVQGRGDPSATPQSSLVRRCLPAKSSCQLRSPIMTVAMVARAEKPRDLPDVGVPRNSYVISTASVSRVSSALWIEQSHGQQPAYQRRSGDHRRSQAEQLPGARSRSTGLEGPARRGLRPCIVLPRRLTGPSGAQHCKPCRAAHDARRPDPRTAR